MVGSINKMCYSGKSHKVESSLKNQTQESTKLGLRPLRHGVRNGA